MHPFMEHSTIHRPPYYSHHGCPLIIPVQWLGPPIVLSHSTKLSSIAQDSGCDHVGTHLLGQRGWKQEGLNKQLCENK